MLKTMPSERTQGEWYAIDLAVMRREDRKTARRQREVAWCGTGGRGASVEEQLANARAIAALPDLIAALEAAVKNFDYGPGYDWLWEEMVRALAKARGAEIPEDAQLLEGSASHQFRWSHARQAMVPIAA